MSAKRMLTNEQVDLVEQIDDYVEWIACYGSATTADVEYLQSLVDNLAKSIAASEKEQQDELAEESPWAEED